MPKLVPDRRFRLAGVCAVSAFALGFMSSGVALATALEGETFAGGGAGSGLAGDLTLAGAVGLLAGVAFGTGVSLAFEAT